DSEVGGNGRRQIARSTNVGERRVSDDRRDFGRKQVVITGIGVMSPNAVGRSNYWRAIKEHRTGISLLNMFDHTPFPVKIAGQIDNSAIEAQVPKRKAARMGRATLLGWLAARLAIEDSKIDLNAVNRDRIGVAMGTTLGALDWAFEQFESL